MALPDLLILISLSPFLKDRLGGYVLHYPGADGALPAGIRGIITGGAEGVPDGLLDRLPALEIVAVHGVGLDKVDLADAHARGIAVTNTPDVLTADVADLAIGLLFAASRAICRNDRFVRDGRWDGPERPPLARRVTGRRIGILGLGRIGLAIAQRAAPFAGEILYHNRNVRSDVPYVHVDSPLALAKAVDILIVATVGGAGTIRLVDRAVMTALGADGLLVNIARGGVVDEAALIDLLESGALGAAALDVFADEPHVPERLRALPNVVLQPHQASATVETRIDMADLVVANLDAHFAGRALLSAA